MIYSVRKLLLLTLAAMCMAGCGGDDEGSLLPDDQERGFRQDMRDFVIRISSYAKTSDPDFLIIPQNGMEILTLDGEADGPVAASYLAAIDGAGREDLFYGFEDDDIATPEPELDWMLGFTDLAEQYDIEVLVTDYCHTTANVDSSYQRNFRKGYISYAADRDLDSFPTYPNLPFGSHEEGVTTLAQARNFLYLLQHPSLPSVRDYLDALQATNFDILLIDAFHDGQLLTAEDVAELRNKPGGSPRLVVAYMSIGEAEDYRYYWQASWAGNPPAWLAAENPDWEGNYKVRYWDTDWQAIILGSPDAYLDKILAAGFDGAYLDIIDAFEYFEDAD